MSEFASADGVLAVHPGNQNRLALLWPEASLNPAITAAFQTGCQSAEYLAVGRSALAIGGAVDLRSVAEPAVVEDGKVYLPVELEAHAPVGHRILDYLGCERQVTAPGQKLLLRGNELPAGRILHVGGLRPVDGEEIERAIRDHFIGLGSGRRGEIPDYRVGDDYLALPPALWKLATHDRKLMEMDQVVDLFLHGRRNLNPYLDARPVQPQDTFDNFTIGTTLISPGPYTVRIEEVSGAETDLRQIAGGAWLDAYRTMGLDPLEDSKKRGQQYEVVGRGGQLRFSEAEVIMRFFRYPGETSRSIVSLDSLSMAKRARLHTYGYDIGRILSKGKRLSAAFHAGSGENCGVVLTRNGVTAVPDDGSPAFNARTMLDALVSSGVHRSGQAKGAILTELTNELGLVGNNPRILVAPELPPRFIPHIAEQSDAQAVVVGESGVPMTGTEHAALLNLVRNGTMVAWATEGKIAKLHRCGLKAEPRAFDRLSELEMVIAMYGGNKDIIGEALRGQINAFFAELISSGTILAHNLGVIHGNGPGVMRVSHELARQHGIMSLGVGMYFNKLGQVRAATQVPDAYTEFDTPDLTPRQELLTNISDIRIYNVGGVGTIGHELGEDMTKTKLMRHLPMPSILVDEPGLFDDTETQYHKFADLKEIQIAGAMVDLRHHPFVQSWVARKLHHVSSYAEATTLIMGFWKQPEAYWQDIGIPRKEFEMCFESHLAKNALLGRRVAPTLIEGAERFMSQQRG